MKDFWTVVVSVYPSAIEPAVKLGTTTESGRTILLT